jgi:hypothetical protein
MIFLETLRVLSMSRLKYPLFWSPPVMTAMRLCFRVIFDPILRVHIGSCGYHVDCRSTSPSSNGQMGAEHELNLWQG